MSGGRTVFKIDGSFVTDVAADDRERAIVLTVVALGNVLGLATTAEGVETSKQFKVLRRLGCTLAQGYLFAPADGGGGADGAARRSLSPPVTGGARTPAARRCCSAPTPASTAPAAAGR